MFFWNSLAFSMIQRTLVVWPLVLLPFLSQAWTSGSSCFYVLLKPGLKIFEDYLTSMWDECSCAVVWTVFGIAFLWDWNETDLFQSYGHCSVFQICWHIEYSSLTASSFRIWSSLTGIPSPPLASFMVILPKAHLTLRSRMSGPRWAIIPLLLSGSLRSLYSSSVFLPPLLNTFYFC